MEWEKDARKTIAVRLIWCALAAFLLLLSLPQTAEALGGEIFYREYLDTPGREDAPQGMQVDLTAAGDDFAIEDGESVRFTAYVEEGGYYHLSYRYEVLGDV